MLVQKYGRIRTQKVTFFITKRVKACIKGYCAYWHGLS